MKKLKKKTAKILCSLLSASVFFMTSCVSQKAEDSNPSNGKIKNFKGYKLVWNDEFDGSELNLNDWNVEEHQPGWVNAELQAYPDEKNSKANIYIEDGHLVIKPIAKKEAGKYSFTSGRINTENKHNFTYGMFETRVKVPAGKGYLPAFWLMAANENPDDSYGVWPECGEIDMMEVLGSDTKTAYGTIHYGNPHSQNQGTFTLKDDDFSKNYHVFRTEWEPGKISWFIDDHLFYQTDKWYSTDSDGRTLTYPAPFDHDMYIILNLAVGGSWTGYPDQATIDDMINQEYDIDYVRVYQKESYNENVNPPEEKKLTLRAPYTDGNYIANGDFSKDEDLSDASSWQFMTQQNGKASAKIENNSITIKTEKAGDVDYSVQLVQANIPMEKNCKYELSFQAKASEKRLMQVAVQAPDRGWVPYKDAEKIALTKENKEYKYIFEVTKESDPNGRIDFNMGAFNSTADITISNVVIKKIGKVDASAIEKVPRKDGNKIYNGAFEEGPDRLAYWQINKGNKKYVSVTNDNIDGKRIRRLKIQAPKSTSEKKAIIISQSDIITANKKEYSLSYELQGPAGKSLTVKLGDFSDSIKASGEKQIVKKTFTLLNAEKKESFEIKITEPGTYYIDSIMLKTSNLGLVKNGDFEEGKTFWAPYVDTSASAALEFTEGQAKISISGTGNQNWHIQLNQDNVNLVKGKKYRLSLKAKSSLNRKIEFGIQHNGSSDNNWESYTSGSETAELTKEFKTFSRSFAMNAPSDFKARLNIALGAINSSEINKEHFIVIDDVLLEEIK